MSLKKMNYLSIYLILNKNLKKKLPDHRIFSLKV